MTDHSDRPADEPDPYALQRAQLHAGNTQEAFSTLDQIPGRYSSRATAELLVLVGDCATANNDPRTAIDRYDRALELIAWDVETDDLALSMSAEAGRAIALCALNHSTAAASGNILNRMVSEIVTIAPSLSPLLTRAFLAQSIMARHTGEPREASMRYLDQALQTCDARNPQLLLQIYIARAATMLQGESNNLYDCLEELNLSYELLRLYDQNELWCRQRVLLAALSTEAAERHFADVSGSSFLVASRQGNIGEARAFLNSMPATARLALGVEYRLLRGIENPSFFS